MSVGASSEPVRQGCRKQAQERHACTPAQFILTHPLTGLSFLAGTDAGVKRTLDDADAVHEVVFLFVCNAMCVCDALHDGEHAETSSIPDPAHAHAQTIRCSTPRSWVGNGRHWENWGILGGTKIWLSKCLWVTSPPGPSLAKVSKVVCPSAISQPLRRSVACWRAKAEG